MCDESTSRSDSHGPDSSWRRSHISRHVCTRPGNDHVTPLDSDASMRTHVSKTVSICFAALRQIRSIRQCVSRQVMLSMVVSLVLQRLDFGNATLVGLPAYQLSRLQCVLNDAALVLSRSKYDHVTPLLPGLHWLRIEQGIEFKLLVFRCLNGLAPSYLSRDLLHASDLAARQCCVRRQCRRTDSIFKAFKRSYNVFVAHVIFLKPVNGRSVAEL